MAVLFDFCKVLPQCTHLSLCERLPHSLKERNTVTILRARHKDTVCGCFQPTVCHNFECLAHVYDESARNDRDINPFAGLVERLESFDGWRRCLEKECHPS